MKQAIQENRLRELRDRSRLTLQEVSILTGFSVPTISRHESGERSLSEDAIIKYSNLYKVHSYELFNIPVGDDE
jgi:transcriptional regulator with XRE-family HTH domain